MQQKQEAAGPLGGKGPKLREAGESPLRTGNVPASLMLDGEQIRKHFINFNSQI